MKSSTLEGFILLRNLWEFNSILKYRYKRLKSYRIAVMKQIPATQSMENKPNIVVRMVKQQCELWKWFFYRVMDFNGIVIQEKTKEKYPDKYERLMNIEVDKPKQLYFKFKVGDLVRCCKGTMYSLLKDRVYVVKSSWDGGINGNMVDLEDVKESLNKWSLFERDLELYVETKQEVREPKLTHVKYVGNNGGTYFTDGKLYEVLDTKIYKRDGVTKTFINFSCNKNNKSHSHSRLLIDGVMDSFDKDNFELIYDNANNNTNILY